MEQQLVTWQLPERSVGNLLMSRFKGSESKWRVKLQTTAVEKNIAALKVSPKHFKDKYP